MEEFVSMSVTKWKKQANFILKTLFSIRSHFNDQIIFNDLFTGTEP